MILLQNVVVLNKRRNIAVTETAAIDDALRSHKSRACKLSCMLQFLAKSLNDLGNEAQNLGKQRSAKLLYRSSALVCPSWSSPWYNLGLQAKYQRCWQESLQFNEHAASLDPEDEASWWNLGIAATAIKDWTTAQKAWKGCGIDLEVQSDGIAMPPVTACVRLNPNGAGEVVWGTRIDPARIQIRNVPLPDSNRHYRDILLNDGAPAGSRKSGDKEYPVFDELDVWQPSMYSTFQSSLSMDDSDAEQHLIQLCDINDIGFEDWGTLRILCATCSQGSPEPHHCPVSTEDNGLNNYGFGSTSREILVEVLNAWAGGVDGRSFSDPHLVLLATK